MATRKQTAPVTITAADGAVDKSVTRLIAGIHGRGRDYTDARNALIAHLLLTGVKASLIVAETGLDKGDVSRVNSASKSLSAATAKRIKSLSTQGMSLDSFESLAVAVTLGVSLRRVKVTTGAAEGKGQGTTDTATSTSTSTTVAGNGESDPDMIAVAFEWLVADYAVRLPLFEAMLANAESYVAEQAATEDAA